jgi:hypothetical protein
MWSALCGSLAWSDGLLLGLFLAGLAGSAVHCVPMCGGFVLGQVADRMARIPAARLCERQRAAGLLPGYHLGRLTTYAAIGAAAAAFTGFSTWTAVVSPLLLALGAAAFLLHALRRLFPGARAALPAIDRAPAGWTRAIAWLAEHTAGGSYPLGVVLGFLPCGLLYAALMSSAASGSALLGGIGMLAFGLGTVPSLVLVGLAGQSLAHGWRRWATRFAPVVLLMNAALLLVLATRGMVHGV